MSAISKAETFEAAAAALAALRLLYLRLHKTQSAIFGFLVFAAVSLAALASIPPSSVLYFRIFVGAAIVAWVLSVLAVHQIFTLALEHYPGIRTAARWAMYAALALAAIVASALAIVTWNDGPAGHSLTLFATEFINRSVVLTLGLFIVVFLGLLSRYPLHLRRNTQVSCGFFAAMLLSESISAIIDMLSPKLYAPTVDAAQVVFAGLCFAGWAAMLTREQHAPQKVSFASPDEARLLRELESINAVLSRSLRK